MNFTDLMKTKIDFAGAIIKATGKTIKETTINNTKELVVIYKSRKVILEEINNRVETITFGQNQITTKYNKDGKK